MTHKKTLCIVDGHSNLYQAFYAIKEMSSPGGLPTNAIYGFVTMLLKLLREQQPDYIAVVFDLPGPTFRHEAYKGYKAHRKPMPPELIDQLPWVKRILTAMRIGVFEEQGYEGDDVMGTLAVRGAREGLRVVLVTRDKDARQLLDDDIVTYDARTDTVFTAMDLEKEWGIAPAQVPELMALAGDKTDNVPGVPGIGPKTAAGLIRRFGSVDGVLADLDTLAGRLRDNVQKERDNLALHRALVTIDTDVGIKPKFDELARCEPDLAGLRDIYMELGFKRFLQQLRSSEPRRELPGARYETVADEASFEKLLSLFETVDEFAVDMETTSTEAMAAVPVGFAFAFPAGRAFYVPVRAPEGEKTLEAKYVMEHLRAILESPKWAKVGQNLKYDALVLRNAGIEMANISFDTMVASYLLEPGSRQHNLDELAARHLDHTTIRIDELIGTGTHQCTMDTVPLSQVTPYACEDADVALRLKDVFEPKLRELSLAKLFREVEMPLVAVLVEMEHNGITVDLDHLGRMSKELAAAATEVEKRIYELAGEEFNIASPKQLSRILFEKLKLPPRRKTKTGISTDSDTLAWLARMHELPARVMEYRQLAKLKETYVDALPKMLSTETGRVHASFNQAVTATGRLSSSGPNLQNIPVRTELGRRIRKAFIPGSPGWSFLSADYSQVELRILAHLSGDPELVAVFVADRDIHTHVAAQIFAVGEDDVTGEMRRKAKAVNFGIIYGQSPFGLARQTGMTVDEATAFIDDYFARFTRVDEFMKELLDRTRVEGFVTTILNRRRYITGVRTSPGRDRNMAERTAINTAVQGSAADLIKVAMNNIHRRIRTESRPSRMLLQIHDELLFELPEEAVEAEAEMIRTQMARAIELSVPVKVDIKIGKNWMET